MTITIKAWKINFFVHNVHVIKFFHLVLSVEKFIFHRLGFKYKSRICLYEEFSCVSAAISQISTHNLNRNFQSIAQICCNLILIFKLVHISYLHFAMQLMACYFFPKYPVLSMNDLCLLWLHPSSSQHFVWLSHLYILPDYQSISVLVNHFEWQNYTEYIGSISQHMSPLSITSIPSIMVVTTLFLYLICQYMTFKKIYKYVSHFWYEFLTTERLQKFWSTNIHDSMGIRV